MTTEAIDLSNQPGLDPNMASERTDVVLRNGELETFYLGNMDSSIRALEDSLPNLNNALQRAFQNAKENGTWEFGNKTEIVDNKLLPLLAKLDTLLEGSLSGSPEEITSFVQNLGEAMANKKFREILRSEETNAENLVAFLTRSNNSHTEAQDDDPRIAELRTQITELQGYYDRATSPAMKEGWRQRLEEAQKELDKLRLASSTHQRLASL